MKDTYITYLHLLTPLHTGGSADEGNIMGIAREVHTEFPYLPSSSVRGKIRSELETEEGAEIFFGHKIKDGQQPTEGEVWFADATLIFFPIASLNHHLVWITCPLWLERWNRWLYDSPLNSLIKDCRNQLKTKSAIVSFEPEFVYLQTAILEDTDCGKLDIASLSNLVEPIAQNNFILSQLTDKLIVLSDEDCVALVEIGLQREVKVTLKKNEKIVEGGSFRSQEAIPPETMMFFPWGTKSPRNETQEIQQKLLSILNKKLQFGGLEGLGRGWSKLHTISTMSEGTV